MSSSPDLHDLIQNIDEQLAQASDSSEAISSLLETKQEEMVRYILVGIGALHLAISIDNLAEVGPLPPLTFLPNLPSWIQGIVNIRSEVVSVVDFGGFLHLEKGTTCNGSRLAVLRYKKRKVGLRLDRIIGTVHRGISEQTPLDNVEDGAVDTSLFGSGLRIGKNFFYILNVQRFLTAPRLIDYNRVG